MQKLKLTTNHTGKMYGLVSLSTYKGLNTFCKEHAKINGSICQHCYVDKALRFGNNKQKFIDNYNILTTRDITENEIKALKLDNFKYVRFEAFGDLQNQQQAKNYLKIVKYYKNTRFALWTKNPMVIIDALHNEGYSKQTGKPKNLNIILSSLYVNKQTTSKFWFVDSTFTVYDKQTAKEKNIKINCGARSCMSCLKCYKKHNNFIEINEILK